MLLKENITNFLSNIFLDKDFSPANEAIKTGKRIEFIVYGRILQGTILNEEGDKFLIDIGSSCTIQMDRKVLMANIVCIHKDIIHE